MTNNEPDISTKIVQNGKETTADTAPETSWVPKNPPPAPPPAPPARAGGRGGAGGPARCVRPHRQSRSGGWAV